MNSINNKRFGHFQLITYCFNLDFFVEDEIKHLQSNLLFFSNTELKIVLKKFLSLRNLFRAKILYINKIIKIFVIHKNEYNLPATF